MLIDQVKVDDKTVELARGFRLNDTVKTPNGPGIVQGRLWNKTNGTIKLIVSHDPKSPGLPEAIRAASKACMWVLYEYNLSDVAR